MREVVGSSPTATTNVINDVRVRKNARLISSVVCIEVLHRASLSSRLKITATKEETNMIVKSIGLAAIIFFGSVTLTEAETFVNSRLAGPNTGLGWNLAISLFVRYCRMV
jgi:hypothetical protein